MRYGFAALKFGGTPEEFGKIKALPPQNSLFSYSTPKEILNFFKMAPEEFHGSSPGWEGGWMDVECNSLIESPSKSVGDDCHILRMKFVGKKMMNNELQFFYDFFKVFSVA